MHPWHLSGSVGYFETDLRFDGADGNSHVDLRQVLAAIGLARDFGDLTLGIRVGAVIDGEVVQRGMRYTLGPGVVVALALDWRVLSAPKDPLTLTLGVQLGVSHVAVSDGAVREPWTASDLRASVTASRTLWDRLTPYLSVRLFGGPVFWRDATGGDTTHVQLALGLGLELFEGLSLHVEGAALAERGVFGGLAVAF